MGIRPAEQLLFDSEATLRLVDNVLDELQVMEAEVSRSEDRVRTLSEHVGRAHAGIAEMPEILLRAYGEIQRVLGSLKHSRDVLEHTTVDRIHITNDKLREVTSETEMAATDILDGLERSLALVDSLDSADPQDTESSAEVRSQLRNELFDVMSRMQFQDITAQQLAYATGVLVDLESRLGQIVQFFDPHGNLRAAESLPASAEPRVYDPAATTRDAEARQAVVDELFGDGSASAT